MTFNTLNHPPLTGQIRTQAEDFQVDEIPVVTPSGMGEHVWLQIRKTNTNTDWVAGQLAKIAAIPRRDVGYAGLKDRLAITTQWFSVQLPGKAAPDWQTSLPPEIEILTETRHDRKLRRGVLQGNQFRIVIRNCQGDKKAVDQRIRLIQQQGVPNYFGEQRFGHENGNIKKAEAWFQGHSKPKNRQLKSLYLSAARSWIFNHVLDQRIKQNNWNQAIPGDIFILNGTQSWFSETIDSAIHQRIAEQDIHPSGPMWGTGDLVSTEITVLLEQSIAAQFPVLTEGLTKHAVQQQRRALRLKVNELQADWLNNTSLCLTFSLTSGSYATSVIRELVNLNPPQVQQTHQTPTE